MSTARRYPTPEQAERGYENGPQLPAL
jgi:hypothetical protein